MLYSSSNSQRYPCGPRTLPLFDSLSRAVPLNGLDATTVDSMVNSYCNTSDVTLEMDELSCRVLLVDDYPTNRLLLRKILEQAGAKVETAQHGGVAISAVLKAERTNRPFDLVITDLDMPVLDGRTMLKALRQGGYRRPVIAISSHDGQDVVRECLEVGFDAFVDKTRAGERLVAAASQHVAASREGDERIEGPNQRQRNELGLDGV